MELELGGIFLAGMLTFVTPCVLPLIPVYLSALVGGDAREAKGAARGQLILRSLAFSSGFIIIFSLFGLGAGGIASFMADNKGIVQLVGGLLILLFGLKFLGFIQIPLLDRVLKANDRGMSKKVGVLNAFIMGIVFAAGWSPCVGPILGSVLTYTASATSEVSTSVLYLTVYGVGFAVPFILTAAFAEAGIKLLAKARRFIPTFERVVGVLLIITAGYLFVDMQAVSGGGSMANEAQACEEVATYNPTTPGEYPLLVEFYAADCPVCKKMAPVVEGLQQECGGNNVEIRQVDISSPEYAKFSKEYKIIGVPTFVLMDTEGDEVARLIGEQTEQSLKQAISALRGEPCPGIGALPDDFLIGIDGAEGAACGSGEDVEASTGDGACETGSLPL